MFVPTFLVGCAGTDGSEPDARDEIVVSSDETVIDMALPPSLTSRKIEPDEYSLTLVVNGNDVAMVSNGDSWEGETFVEFGADLNVSLAWSAQGVPLANLTQNYGTASATNPISISPADYVYIDSDDDGLSNFAELNAEPVSDPYDENSPGDADTSAISGVYQDILLDGDQFGIFVSEVGTYEILDYRGDVVDNEDDCWALDTSVYTVRRTGDAIYNFEASFAIDGGEYSVSLEEASGDENAMLILQSSNETLDWERFVDRYLLPGTFLEAEFYCDA